MAGLSVRGWAVGWRVEGFVLSQPECNQDNLTSPLSGLSVTPRPPATDTRTYVTVKNNFYREVQYDRALQTKLL